MRQLLRLALVLLCLWPTLAVAEPASVVGLIARAAPDARSAATLGRERIGSAVAIDASGLAVTIGYLVLESESIELVVGQRRVPAAFVGFDHETGFGLVRAVVPLGVPAARLASAAGIEARSPVTAVAFGTSHLVALADQRRFTGDWEYMVERALFTTPPLPVAWSGAGLFDGQGRLIGIGSLQVPDALRQPRTAGNMFVPIDLLRPLLGDLITFGRRDGPGRPWLGLAAQDLGGRLMVGRVSGGGPAEAAGVTRGDLLIALDGQPITTLDRFYERLWALGPAGTAVPLTVQRGSDRVTLTLRSIDRMDHLRRAGSY